MNRETNVLDVLIVGAGEMGSMLASELQHNRERHYRAVAFRESVFIEDLD